MTNILCEHCKKGYLVLMTGDEPYNGDHYQCSECDSTYPVDFQRRNLSIDYWLENTNNIYEHQQNDYHVSSIIIDAFEAGYDSRNKEIADLNELGEETYERMKYWRGRFFKLRKETEDNMCQCNNRMLQAQYGALQGSGLGMQAQEAARRMALAAAQAPFYREPFVKAKKKKHELKNGNRTGLRLFAEKFKEFQND